MAKEFTLKELKHHAKVGITHDWVYEFLHSVGKNKGMASGLKRDHAAKKVFWVGPVFFPLTQLTRCTGPEKHSEYPQAPKRWERRVSEMVSAIKNGWIPPVLIVNPRPWPILSIRDGNHRYEALQRSRKKKFWTLFWFDSKKDEQRFKRKFAGLIK